MKLKVERRFRAPEYTIGTIYVDGVRLCDTLEDTDRGLRSDMPLDVIESHKVQGQTAIPEGEYRVTVSRSPRFGRDLPRLHNVPGFSGILIHSGNTSADTSGCILVGENREKGKVLQSRHWERELMRLIDGQTSITIEML